MLNIFFKIVSKEIIILVFKSISQKSLIFKRYNFLFVDYLSIDTGSFRHILILVIFSCACSGATSLGAKRNNILLSLNFDKEKPR
jgi:hypothetical protein